MTSKSVLLFVLALLIAPQLLTSILVADAPLLLSSLLFSALRILTLSCATAIAIAISFTAILLSPVTRDLHANFTRGQCLNSRSPLGLALTLLLGTRGGSLLLLSLATCIGGRFALRTFVFPSLLILILILWLRSRGTLSFSLGLPCVALFLSLLAAFLAAASPALGVRSVCCAQLTGPGQALTKRKCFDNLISLKIPF